MHRAFPIAVRAGIASGPGSWPEATNNVRRPIGGRVVHHEHPHLESARHLGGEQALERPGQERPRLNVGRMTSTIITGLPRAAGRWPWPPPARAPWRRTTRRRPVLSLFRACRKDPPRRRAWTPIRMRIGQRCLDGGERLDRGFADRSRIGQKPDVLFADVRAAKELRDVNADERSIAQQVFESSRTVVRDHDVGRSQVRADVGIRHQVSGLPLHQAGQAAGQSMPPE